MKVVMLGGNTKEEIKRRLQVVASAGALSRSEGTVTEVYDNHNDYESNLKLARAVVGYGHRSISEHDYIVFALEDVTPIIEQIIIGYRLTSFTIKSRRNVDFRDVGFYVPEFKDENGEILSNSEQLQEKYIEYMKSLFDKYGKLVDKEIPVEDCRYILPYSYHSNIIMGLDANQLFRMTSDFLYGKLSHISEVKELGENLKKIIEENVPYLTKTLENESKKEYYGDKFGYLDELVDSNTLNKEEILDKAKMTNYTKDADLFVCYNIIANRYQVSIDKAKKVLDELLNQDADIKSKLMMSLLQSKNQRELEQVIFSFEMPISLAVLTHITRHRMHSLLVPDFVPLWNLDNYITPETVAKDNKDEYDKIFADNKKMMEYFKENGVCDEDLIYFYLSGNVCNIHTTMNARTLEWISRMRCCKKAQWEIRELINECVKQAKEECELIGTCLGPTCQVEDVCYEGKDSCMNRGVVVKKRV